MGMAFDNVCNFPSKVIRCSIVSQTDSLRSVRMALRTVLHAHVHTLAGLGTTNKSTQIQAAFGAGSSPMCVDSVSRKENALMSRELGTHALSNLISCPPVQPAV